MTPIRCLLLVLLVSALPAWAGVRIQLDYTYDTRGFFTVPERRAAMDYAVALLSRHSDTLARIAPSGGNEWSAITNHPGTGAELKLPGLVVPADTLIVYVGARPLGGPLGIGGPGGWSARGYGDWFDVIDHRGQSGEGATPPTDFGPWGGAISFNLDTNWHFGLDSGPGFYEYDFLSVAVHELAHVLGVGTASSWDAWQRTDPLDASLWFDGPAAAGVFGGPVPLENPGHWADEVTGLAGGTEQPAAMTPALVNGQRTLFTDLDHAALLDIGWTAALAGDANLDGTVDDRDLSLLLAHWAQGVTAWGTGDFDNTTAVDDRDLSLLLSHWATGSTVPEPTGLALLGLATLALRRRP